MIILPDNIVSVAFETNLKGYIGFIPELPGAFIRGRTEPDALLKIDKEVQSYLKWLGISPEPNYNSVIVQTHQSSLMVEDADNEILLDKEKEAMGEAEFTNLIERVWYSGETFLKIYTNAKLKEWVDTERIRKTFYGENPKTIKEVFHHVKNCQYYYLSRTGILFEDKEEDFMKIRELCLDKIEKLYRESNNSLIFDADNELWTLKKILRRFLWHDRIHGKAMVRILEKQRQLGIIDEYEDHFHFSELTSYKNI